MKIVIGNDHAGFEMKEFLKKWLTNEGHEIIDAGCADDAPCDYPEFAQKVAHKVIDEKILGILICGTGIGMSIAANRIKGARCALCISEKMAMLARQHNDANIVAIGGQNMAKVPAQKVIAKFLSTEFSGEQRHIRRNAKVDEF